ncbi:MAG TPA: UDP-N-acetylmuramoyl-L-alanyl-D-glutamate--2,6-diaminopimelate ligase [Peptococcaceae bacterium]|nr:UDP-N-acetylmuramoyl-L-alanyl-D-glutamate--2,6-diaminopimelate ligase [Peptococcaceae bacterium]
MTRNGRTLEELIKGIPGAQISGDSHVLITGLTHDSRKVRPGDIYACIPGFKFDGHDFAVAALANGAKALLVERFLKLDIPQVKVKNTRDTVGYLAAKFFDFPSRRLELIGVTGTNGKTTVTHLIEKIAHTAGKKTGLIGTLGARIGERQLPGEHTTPEATELQQLLAEMVQEKVETAVMEVSSHALDLGRVNGCVFRAGIFTNLTQDHLDYHQNMQEYLEAKALLFAGLKEGEKQLAVLNADDSSYPYLKEKAACRVVSYGVDSQADFQATHIKLSDQGVEFLVNYQGEQTEIFYSTPGKFSVYNALAAFAWAVSSGYPPEIVVKALAEIKGVPGRFQSIRFGQPFLVIVDYAHTPDGLKNVLSTAREITSGRLITVFGCGGDRDRTKRPLMGEAAGRLSDYVVVTSDNPRTEEPMKIIEDILPGIGQVDYRVIVDRREAINHACSVARPGDTVLIAGKGHEDYQIIGTEKIHFDDREEVEIALRRNGYVD